MKMRRKIFLNLRRRMMMLAREEMNLVRIVRRRNHVK
jgi:hypothetical protein